MSLVAEFSLMARAISEVLSTLGWGAINTRSGSSELTAFDTMWLQLQATTLKPVRMASRLTCGESRPGASTIRSFRLFMTR